MTKARALERLERAMTSLDEARAALRASTNRRGENNRRKIEEAAYFLNDTIALLDAAKVYFQEQGEMP